MFQICYHMFLYCLKCFGHKCGVRGSRFGHIFGRSRNVPKSIAIDQGSLINHFGIIKKLRNTKTNSFLPYSAPLPPRASSVVWSWQAPQHFIGPSAQQADVACCQACSGICLFVVVLKIIGHHTEIIGKS